MRYRFIAAALTVSALAVPTSGCFKQQDKVPQRTAHITVDGKSRTSHAVNCTQVQWLLTVAITAAPARINMVLNTQRGEPEPETVSIENLDGFNGVANAAVGRAHAGFANDTYTVTGSAQGTNPTDVNHPRTVDFRISANC